MISIALSGLSGCADNPILDPDSKGTGGGSYGYIPLSPSEGHWAENPTDSVEGATKAFSQPARNPHLF